LNTENTIRLDTSSRHFRKYNSKNTIQAITLDRFFNSITKEITRIKSERVLEFGCGEGFFIQELKKRNLRFNHLTGIDLRIDAINTARTLHPEYEFVLADIMTWEKGNNEFDLVIASQVLEHLISPNQILAKLATLGNANFLLTVPWEPWFQIMNFLRGRDFLRLGNHPEHINHWGVSTFRKFVGSHLSIEKSYTVFPFIIITARVKI
jgi:trans-aconitate methyltransferase